MKNILSKIAVFLILCHAAAVAAIILGQEWLKPIYGISEPMQETVIPWLDIFGTVVWTCLLLLLFCLLEMGGENLRDDRELGTIILCAVVLVTEPALQMAGTLLQNLFVFSGSVEQIANYAVLGNFFELVRPVMLAAYVLLLIAASIRLGRKKEARGR